MMAAWSFSQVRGAGAGGSDSLVRGVLVKEGPRWCR